MSAAMGINTSSLEDLGSTRSLSSHSSTSSSSFTVVQALVSLLTQGGWHARLLQAQLSGEKCEFRHCLSGGDSMRAHVWALPHTYMHANTRTHHTPHNTCNTHTHIHTHTHITHTHTWEKIRSPHDNNNSCICNPTLKPSRTHIHTQPLPRKRPQSFFMVLIQMSKFPSCRHD